MPPTFTRRKQNHSFLRKGVMVWTVELDVEGIETKQIVHKMEETSTIRHILNQSASPIDVSWMVFLPVVGRPQNDPRYFHISDPDSMTLRSVLVGRALIEFPTLVVRSSMDSKLLAREDLVVDEPILEEDVLEEVAVEPQDNVKEDDIMELPSEDSAPSVPPDEEEDEVQVQDDVVDDGVDDDDDDEDDDDGDEIFAATGRVFNDESANLWG